jgi:hypothetical protein
MATVSLNPLKAFSLQIATNMQAEDGVTTYITTVLGQRYLTTTGGSLFLAGVHSLDAMCPSLFQAGLASLSPPTAYAPGTYGASLTPLSQLGTTIANGLTNMGVFLGVGSLSGSFVLMLALIIVAVYIFQRTQSGIAVVLLGGSAPVIGAYFGLMPLALAFTLGFFIIILMSWFFFSRGIL